MKKDYIVSMLTILLSFLSSEVAISSDLLFPVVIGQKFFYERYYDAFSYNFWITEYEIIGEVNMCSENYTHLRRRNYIHNGETKDYYFRSTDTCIYVCISGVECCSLGIGPVGKTWTCGGDEIEIMPSAEVNISYGDYAGDYTAVVNKKYNTVENSPPWVTYLVPGLGIVKEVDYWNDYPPMTMELIKIKYHLAEITGTWSNGIRYWDEAASKWTQMTSYTTTGDIAAGDFTGDGKADVASIWSDGLWYQDGDTLDWAKIDNSPPYRVTAGAETGK